MAFYGNGVATFKALKAELEDRQGRRTDLGLMRKCAEVGPGERATDLAAKRPGLGDRKTALGLRDNFPEVEPFRYGNASSP